MVGGAPGLQDDFLSDVEAPRMTADDRVMTSLVQSTCVFRKGYSRSG